MHRQFNFYSQPLSFYFYGRCLGIVFCSLLSVFFAVVAMPIPNLTFIFYGFALVMLWQCLPIISQIFIKSYGNYKKDGMLWGIIFSLVWIAISIFSWYSCISLFPNPAIHTVMIEIIYYTGIFVGIWILWQCHVVGNKILSDEMKEAIGTLLEKHERCMEWKELCTQKITEYNLSNSLVRRQYVNDETRQEFPLIKRQFLVHCIVMIGWLLIPAYIFIYIPFQSYDNIKDFPLFYKWACYATIVFVSIRVFIYIINGLREYCVTKNGIQIRYFYKIDSISWYNISYVYIQKDFLYLFCWNKKVIKFNLKEFENFGEFLESLATYLPLCIFSIDYAAQRKLEIILSEHSNLALLLDILNK